MENFYPGHPFIPPPEMYNFRPNDGMEYYNPHAIPVNPPPVHVPYYAPPVQPDFPHHQQQISPPMDSRIVTFKNSKNRSRYQNRRSNLIEVRSTTQSFGKVRTVEPIQQPFVNEPIIETKVVKSAPIESKSPYKSHSYSSERYSRTPTKLPSSSSTYSQSKSFKNASKKNWPKSYKPRNYERDYYKKYYYKDKLHSKDDRWKKKNWSSDKQASSKEPLKEKGSNLEKQMKPDSDVLEDVSDTALDDDFEEVEVVSGVDLKENELSVGFRKCKVRYLGYKKKAFYKPKFYCICPKRTVINYQNLDTEEWNGNEEVYEMEIENFEKSELKSGKNDDKKIVQEGNNMSSKSSPLKKTSTDTTQNAVDELVTSSRSYRICMPEISEFFQGEAIIQPDIDAWKSHLIGLNYIIEIRDKSDDTNILRHRCALCSEDIHAENDSGQMVIDHISSYKHMFKYLL